jgi:hypothetical protein
VHGGVGGDSLGVKSSAGGVGELGDVEAVVELEDGLGEVLERGEGDVGGGGKVVGGGIDFGVDDVAGDVELRADGCGECGEGQGAEGEDCGGEDAGGGAGSEFGRFRTIDDWTQESGSGFG